MVEKVEVVAEEESVFEVMMVWMLHNGHVELMVEMEEMEAMVEMLQVALLLEMVAMFKS